MWPNSAELEYGDLIVLSFFNNGHIHGHYQSHNMKYIIYCHYESPLWITIVIIYKLSNGMNCHYVYMLWEEALGSFCHPRGSLGSLTLEDGPRGLRGNDWPKLLFGFLYFLISGDNRRILASSLIFTAGGTLPRLLLLLPHCCCCCCSWCCWVRSGDEVVRLFSEQLLVRVGSVAVLCFKNWLVGTL